MTTKRKKIRFLLEKLSTLEDSLPNADKKSIAIKYLDGINNKLAQFKEDFNLEPINSIIDGISGDVALLKEDVAHEIDILSNESKIRTKELVDAIKMAKKDLIPVANAIGSLASKSAHQNTASKEETTALRGLIKIIEARLSDITNDLKWANEFSSNLVKDTEEKVISDIEVKVDDLRKDLLQRLANLPHGGNANRQIVVGGVDVLTRYTDINLVAGSGVSITTANNDTNRRVNITFSAVGSTILSETPSRTSPANCCPTEPRRSWDIPGTSLGAAQRMPAVGDEIPFRAGFCLMLLSCPTNSIPQEETSGVFV